MNNDQLQEKILEVSKTIFSYCMAKTRNREEAEDLSQEILCELLKSSKDIRNAEAFYGFMWAVAGNVYKQWCRKRTRMQTSELTEDIPVEVEFLEEEDMDIYLLRRELTLLSEKYRHATILYYIDRKSCAEISQILSITESMVKYLLFKSRQILKEGMNMERKLGTLSYNPKSLVPLYCGTGPNRFWDFMRSKVRQNIVNACYNDTLTAEQISLETGLPLPYIDDDIDALVEKQILIRDGKHYKANVIIVTADCADEMKRSAVTYHNQIADCLGKYLEDHLEAFKQIGFSGNDFSDNTLRWQLLVQILRMMNQQDDELENEENYPQTAWGDRAYLMLAERGTEESSRHFNHCEVSSRQGDWILFFDYLPNIKGDHHDFYANDRYINIFCDIAKGNSSNFSEYDLEAVADMIRKGYVRKEGDNFYVTTPILTAEQFQKLTAALDTFVKEELGSILKELDHSAECILKEHTPRHLQSQVAAIARMDKFVQAICIPARILVERKVLSTAWNPLEMPTTMVVINNEN